MQSKHPNITMDIEPLDTIEEYETWIKNLMEVQGELIRQERVAAATKAMADFEGVVDHLSDEEDLAIETHQDYYMNEIKEDEEINSDEEKGNEIISTPSEEKSEPIICKHCTASFTKLRGFKRHVHLKHLKRMRYLCPHCDRSSNCETTLLQHIRSRHQGLPVNVVENPNSNLVQLTPEFWAREYGIVEHKVDPHPVNKKRKRVEVEDFAEIRNEFSFPCDRCDYIAVSQISLRNHQRIHETKVRQKCCYCSFSTFNSSEMRQHWDVNHRPNEFKVMDWNYYI